MSFHATIQVGPTGDIILQLGGNLQFGYDHKIYRELEELFHANPLANIILDFYNLDFVGSSGIGPFIQTLKKIHEEHRRLRMANLRPEFVKVFAIYQFPVEHLLCGENDGHFLSVIPESQIQEKKRRPKSSLKKWAD